MKNMGKKIILASGSPRRSELLRKAGISFEVLVTDADENVEISLLSEEYAAEVSKRKARAAAEICMQNHEDVTIIAADTIVCINGKILGKPDNGTEAYEMIKLLENGWHSVYTGMTFAFVSGKSVKYIQDCCRTDVKFKPLTDSEIWDYINTGEPFDKAGGYGIQGEAGKFFAEIKGDYNNVVGLPVNRCLDILKLYM